DALRTVAKFGNFSEAWAFMTAVAMEAEKRDHHPDWSNAYNVVEISLRTHSQNRITLKDLELAEAIEIWGKRLGAVGWQ
ncbi:MAG: 4a-hydroxytetrahydrobiopterin dehydratase, partial [Bacteroidia bacterium]|nr:4a-hydroxytetrahydrobiopterin dehydratase [Bacteroidia bacterium]